MKAGEKRDYFFLFLNYCISNVDVVMLLSKCKFTVENYDTIINPLNHSHFKQPLFETRERPIPIHIEIEEENCTNEEEVQIKIDVKHEIENKEMMKEDKGKIVQNIKEFYDLFIHKTKEECKEESNFPQKSDGWLKSRHYCITASQFGTAIGDSPYQTPEELVHEKVYKKFQGNSATEYGNDHEDHARQVFCDWYKTKLEERGCSEIQFIEMNLIKFWQCPWVGVSPDGLVKYMDETQTLRWELIEYKCPARYKANHENPYEKFSYGVPPQYMAQIQGIMGYCNLFSEEINIDCAWFVVWLPSKTYIKKVLYNKMYFDELQIKLKTWYFEKYLPICFQKYSETLQKQKALLL